MAIVRFKEKDPTSVIDLADIFILTQNSTDEDKRVVASVLAEFVRQYSGDGTWLKPLRLNTARIWHDETNDVTRVKYGSNPDNELDGKFYQEAGGPGLE